MKKPSTRSHVHRAAAVAALAFGCIAAQADVVTSASIAGDPAALLNSLDTIGTFTFAPPPAVVTHASLSLDSYDVLFDNTASFFLDGVLLGTLGFGIDQSANFAVTDFSIFSDGSAVLSSGGHRLRLRLSLRDTQQRGAARRSDRPTRHRCPSRPACRWCWPDWPPPALLTHGDGGYLVKPLGLFAGRALREP